MTPLSTQSLTIGYADKTIQRGLTLSAPEGTLICLLGTNGCGKSTLLRTLAGLQPPLSGDVTLCGSSLLAMRESERAKHLAVVLTERLSADRTTVRDVAALGRFPYTSFLAALSRDDEDIVTRALTRTGMIDKQYEYFNCLSDGEKQRTLIAKALAQQTPLILLDEPTAHLDLPNRIKTMLLLRELAHNERKTVIISTHELDLALQTADLLWLMTPLASSISTSTLTSTLTSSSSSGVLVGSPADLVAAGAFQRAFADSAFSFVTSGTRLSINIRD